MIFTLPLWAQEEGQPSDFLDLQLLDKGQHLYQTKTNSAGKAFFMLKQIFPSATTTTKTGNSQSPSMTSKNSAGSNDGVYRLFATVGQLGSGSSEDTAHFRMKAGFFTTARKSVFVIREVRTRRNPISVPRGF